MSGAQIAILIFAATLLGVPAAKLMVNGLGLPADEVGLVARVISFSLEILVLLSIPSVRRAARRMLSFPIGAEHYLEVALVCAALSIGKFAAFGERALRSWLQTGDAAGLIPVFYLDPEQRLANAVGISATATLCITTLVAPVVEEILFRGFLLKAWLRRWHWLIAMLLTSSVFALCHDFYFVPFTAGLVLAAIYWRTGSLRAAIVVHAVTNFIFWYPLLGRYTVPAQSHDLASWRFHLAALGAFLVFLVAYVASARPPRRAEAEAFAQTA